MFIIPIPPTIKDTLAIDASKIVNALVAVSAVEEISAKFETLKSFSHFF